MANKLFINLGINSVTSDERLFFERSQFSLKFSNVIFRFYAAEETEDDEVAAAGYEVYYTKAVDDSHIPKLNDTSFNSTIRLYDTSVVFFFLPCKFIISIPLFVTRSSHLVSE